MKKIRIATYNVHKCVGMDRRYAPERIVDVLREVDADIVAMQEVLCHSRRDRRDHQAEYIASELGMDYRLGENRRIKGGGYGNAVLSRLPIIGSENYDITIHKYEPRGCLRTEIQAGNRLLQFMSLHMGTSFFERRKQIHSLLAKHVLDQKKFAGNRIIAGDFNEWTHGLTTKMFEKNFNGIDARLHLGKARTFPGIFPLFHLDHIYFDDSFRLLSASLFRTRSSLTASDHLPIVAELSI